MTLGVQLVTGPSSEPLTLETAKQHLRVDFPDDDTLITSLIAAAREVVEGKLRRSICSQTWKLTLDQFPYPTQVLTKTPSQRDNYLFPSLYYSYYAIELPRTKVTAVNSIIVGLEDGSTITLDPSTYAIDMNSEPARIVPVNGSTWPYTDSFLPGSIVIEFVTGQWTSTTVPSSVAQAMLLLIGHWYNNREAVTQLNLKNTPLAVDALLERWIFYDG